MAEAPEQRARREIDADLADSAEVVKSNETVGFGN